VLREFKILLAIFLLTVFTVKIACSFAPAFAEKKESTSMQLDQDSKTEKSEADKEGATKDKKCADEIYYPSPAPFLFNHFVTLRGVYNSRPSEQDFALSVPTPPPDTVC
jgi:hypothetical protein